MLVALGESRSPRPPVRVAGLTRFPRPQIFETRRVWHRLPEYVRITVPSLLRGRDERAVGPRGTYSRAYRSSARLGVPVRVAQERVGSVSQAVRAAAGWLTALDPLSHQAGVLAVFLGNGHVAVWPKSSRHLTDGNLPVLSGPPCLPTGAMASEERDDAIGGLRDPKSQNANLALTFPRE